ncbi:bifunctional phosphoribosylaminoimidazolecarboxamide formyltransferase/IMP cyclohydrolase [Atopococcus tabaci]|uniref:bifunctional phosphoribosylaminoimidazolecarboxamide formyltransferase/IMP cyclohydrolase n=1 Tax=Atopococcus tabaci TaxID=269774 RepID=UPI002409AAD8|nr:bifunctional phosphoribosylaminoimidazolecarboxamide formyltransferase/IMP cyclohydrolase [Atopococcus tabaci]
MTDKRFALLSVSDKTGLEAVAEALTNQGIGLLSSGGTHDYLKQAGFDVQTVESYTKFPEMMGGRVKTLHPKVHGGLLADTENNMHREQMEEQDIYSIDFVIVNLYPFKDTVLKEGVTLEEAVENIDIGGPTMLRSAAKNFNRVSVVTDPADYPAFIRQLEENGGTTLDYRFYLSSKVFELTSHYDALISQYMNQQRTRLNETEKPWDHLTKTYADKTELRYGENSHQQASFYKDVFASTDSIAGAKQLHGKALSYNNIKDADAALRIIHEFDEPAAVAVKHMNPCGAAIGRSIEEAFDRCFLADSVSIFGGIVAVNRPVTKELAEKLHSIFLEIVLAPSFEPEALDVLTKKKNIRLLEVTMTAGDQAAEELTAVSGGVLIQEMDQSSELTKDAADTLPEDWEQMTKRAPDAGQIKAMNFLMKIAKHVKSNAIVVGNDYMTLGIGAGQMNRVGAAEIALKQARDNQNVDTDNLVMASDAFFPMDDTVTLAHEYGVSAVIQPGGSIRDKDSVAACDERDMTMVKTGIRHFRH